MYCCAKRLTATIFTARRIAAATVSEGLME